MTGPLFPLDALAGYTVTTLDSITYTLTPATKGTRTMNLTEGTLVTLALVRGDSLPAWDEPTCTRRWAGLVVPDGMHGVAVEPCPRLDDQDHGATWWIVHFPSVGLWAPAEIHDHLGVIDEPPADNTDNYQSRAEWREVPQ